MRRSPVSGFRREFEFDEITGLQSRPEITGLQSRPEITGLQSRPEITGLQSRPEITGLQSRPEITGLQSAHKKKPDTMCPAFPSSGRITPEFGKIRLPLPPISFVNSLI
jgi:hypothetical protein